ncbi:MAG: hypothetical protein D6725_10110, partial [Planctomycetota bacterium]
TSRTGERDVASARRLPTPLLRWQFLVGQWRGVGQPRRGSTRGAWRETLHWRWDFTTNAPRLVATPRESKLFQSLSVSWNEADARIVFSVALASGERGRFPVKAGVTDFSAEAAAEPRRSADVPNGIAAGAPSGNNPRARSEWVLRLDLRKRNEDRFVVTLYRRHAASRSWSRVAEVAYQRIGTRLAAFDTSGPVCVVTGGRGTIAVTHAGKTYYVCCSGCREAFEADPEGILREYFENRKRTSKDVRSQ